MGRGKRRLLRTGARAATGRSACTVVIPDVHGQPDLLRGLLEAAGAVDAAGERRPGVRVVGIGDLVHGSMDSELGDAACLDIAERVFDCCLIGNHEAALLGLTYFTGLWTQSPIASRVRSLTFRGFFVPALLEGQTLLTHAGVAPAFAGADAKETYEKIMHAWQDDPHSPLFNAVSSPKRTRQPAPAGGIFWLDWDEPRAQAFSQVVGHSPRQDAELAESTNDVFHLNVDAGGKSGRQLVAAVLEDGEPVELVTFTRSAD